MKFLNKYKPEEATSTDPHRFVLGNVMVDIFDDRPVMVASDGMMIAVIPCEIDSIHEVGLVSKDALEAARKASRVKKKEYPVVVELNGEAKVNDVNAVHTFSRMPDQKYPKWTTLPQFSNGFKKTYTISINPKFLLRLAKAINAADAVTLEISEEEGRPENQSIKLTPYDRHDPAFGIMMPLRTKEKRSAS